MHLQESVDEMKKFNARRKLKVSGCAVKGLDLHNGVFRFVLSENGKIKWCFFPCQGAILAAVASRKCPSKIIREYFMTLMVRSHHI